jgi:uncharacterized iron-regulated protein
MLERPKFARSNETFVYDDLSDCNCTSCQFTAFGRDGFLDRATLAIYAASKCSIMRILIASMFSLWVSSACAQSIYLLGEIHDNAQGHAERFEFIKSIAETSPKLVIVMEQFDRERQADLDQAMASCADADCVIQRVGGRGWDWAFYKPVITFAMARGVRLAAANVSGKDVFAIAKSGFSAALDAQTIRAFALDQPLNADLIAGQSEAIDEGHCRMLPKQALGGMLNAQVARDVWMAKTIQNHAQLLVILLAGNGHVRKDIGVFRWLSPEQRLRTEVTAFSESETTVNSALFDKVTRVPKLERADPCLVFKKSG